MIPLELSKSTIDFTIGDSDQSKFFIATALFESLADE
jgi:hypothetical protein